MMILRWQRHEVTSNGEEMDKDVSIPLIDFVRDKNPAQHRYRFLDHGKG